MNLGECVGTLSCIFFVTCNLVSDAVAVGTSCLVRLHSVACEVVPAEFALNSAFLDKLCTRHGISILDRWNILWRCYDETLMRIGKLDREIDTPIGTRFSGNMSWGY